MELYKVSVPNSADTEPFRVEEIIEGYDSLIWTERYLEHSEFELKTSNIRLFNDQFPLLSLMCINDSSELMFVETKTVTRDEQGKGVYVIKGRSVTSLLESRIIDGPHGVKFAMSRNYTDLDAALAYIWNSVRNDSDTDVSRPYTTMWNSLYARNNFVRVLGSLVSDSTTKSPGAAVQQWVQEGVAWPVIKALLEKNDYGFRILRSPVRAAVKKVVFDPVDGANKGAVTKSMVTDTTKMYWDVYNGVDRSKNQLVNPRVVFDVLQGHLGSASYLFGAKDYMSEAVVASSVGKVLAIDPVEASPLLANFWKSGLGLRVMHVDGGTPAEGANITAYLNSLNAMGVKELTKYNRVTLIDGAIAPNNPFKYGTDYFLGDRVSLSGEYNVNSTMQVTEFIRGDDENGYSEYPSLTYVF